MSIKLIILPLLYVNDALILHYISKYLIMALIKQVGLFPKYEDYQSDANVTLYATWDLPSPLISQYNKILSIM